MKKSGSAPAGIGKHPAIEVPQTGAKSSASQTGAKSSASQTGAKSSASQTAGAKSSASQTAGAKSSASEKTPTTIPHVTAAVTPGASTAGQSGSSSPVKKYPTAEATKTGWNRLQEAILM